MLFRVAFSCVLCILCAMAREVRRTFTIGANAENLFVGGNFVAIKQIKRLEKLLVGIGIVLVVVIVVCLILCSRADKVSAPEAIPVLTTSTTTTTITTTMATTTVTYDYTMHIDMEKVKNHHEVNPDVVGWVYVADTPIDYPIVQSEDNAYYMDKDWQKNYSSAGSIFEDFRGEINQTENTLLYGHNMGNGSMFHAVKNFKDEAWGKEHIYFEVATLEKRYIYRIVASSVLNGEYGAEFDYWNRITLHAEEFKKYIDEIRSTALVWYAPEDDLPEYGDKMIALQTCNSGADDGIRCLLFGQCLGEY